MIQRPIISVIVPVFNLENYIEECIGSIKQQTLQSFEVILINDGSTDNSLEIIRSNTTKSAQFRVYNQPNSGVSTARNLGLHHAQGEYIAFIDGDDIVPSNFLETLLDTIQGTDMAIVGSENLLPDGSTTSRHEVHSKVYSTTNDPLKLIRHHANGEWEYPNWNKLYRSNIIRRNKLKFQLELAIGEDYTFTLEYLFHAKSARTTNLTKYTYRTRKESTFRSADSKKIWSEHCKKCLVIEKVINASDFYQRKKLTKLLINSPTIFTAFPAIRKSIQTLPNPKPNNLKIELSRARYNWFNPAGLPVSWKAFITLALYSQKIEWPSVIYWTRKKLM